MGRRYRVFGRDLKELQEHNKGCPPTVFQDSLDVLRQRGLKVAGLFLGHADRRKVELLRLAWDQGQNPLRSCNVQDSHAVAESLLLWLRSLPGPLIPCKLYRPFLRLQHANSQTECLAALQHLLRQMASYELQILVPLLEFLHDYYVTQRDVRFDTPSLGAIFAPLLLRAQEGPLPLPFPEDMRAAAALVDCMISDYHVIFGSPVASVSAHKPPSRAKRAPTSPRGRGAGQGFARKGTGEGGAVSRLGRPSMAAEVWPGKHLRVVVVPPLENAEVCFMDSDEGTPSTPERNERPAASFNACLELCEGNAMHQANPGGLPSVPEGCPLGCPNGPVDIVSGRDGELDNLVGELLVGSLEGMLFTDNDDTFHARATVASVQSASTLAGHCSCSSTDCSSDEDMLDTLDSPMIGATCAGMAAPRRVSHRSSFDSWLKHN